MDPIYHIHTHTRTHAYTDTHTHTGTKEQEDSKAMSVPSESQTMSVLASIRQFYEMGDFCDIGIQVGSETLECHRLVLAAHSEYFLCLFMSDFQEKNMRVLNLTDSFENFYLLKTLVDTMYGIAIKFTTESEPALIRAAQFMLYGHAVEKGKSYLLGNLTIRNSISTFLAACVLNLFEVSSVAEYLTVSRFEDADMCRLEEALQLTLPQLFRLPEAK